MFRSKIALLTVICVLMTGLLVACSETNTPASTPQTGNITQPAQSQSAQNSGSNQPTRQASNAGIGSPLSPGASPVEQAIANPTSRGFKYANLEFKLTQGVISTQPGSDLGASNPNGAQLKLTLAITNPTKEVIRVSAGLFQIKLGNGTVLKQPVDLSLQARDTKPYDLLFNVPLASKWEGAQLQLDEKDKEPVLMALDGRVTTSPYPITLAADTEARVEKPKVTYKLTSASLDLDAQGERVEKGKYFLVMSILASNREDKSEVYVGDENFRLMIDGKPQSPDKIDPVATGVKELGKQDFALAFAIPQAAKSVTLEVGEPGKGAATLALELNAASAATTPTARPEADNPVSPAVTPKPGATRSAAKASPVSSKAPASTKVAQTGTTSTADPCSLFTKEDFAAVFSKAATDGDQENFSEWSSCSYEFADLAQTSDTAYGLEIRLLKGDFTRQKFDSTYEVLLPRMQKVDGLGDIAYLLPSDSADNVAALFILKGKTSLSLSMLELPSVTAAQKQTELKAAAQKLLAHL